MCNNDERCVGAMLHVYGINMKERASALWSPWLLMKGDLVLITSEIYRYELVAFLAGPIFRVEPFHHSFVPSSTQVDVGMFFLKPSLPKERRAMHQ